MTDKQIKKLNKLTEISQELGLYEDRPDWRITLQADHIKRLEEELQAKEQECEELAYENYELNELFDRLKAENEELKKCYKNNSALLDFEETNTTKLVNKVMKLEKILTEIKEIARVNSINTCWTAINLCADCDEIEECGLQSPFEKLKAIIQKIDECGVMDE